MVVAAERHVEFAQNLCDLRGIEVREDERDGLRVFATQRAAIAPGFGVGTDELVISGNTFTGIISAGKGAYGVILNNGAGVPAAQITNNAFSALSGG